jgi:NhaP-type Na+/H+ or K+/H+ antiporter
MSGGGLFRALTFEAVAFALIALFVVRPLSGWIGLIGSGRPVEERAVISFFGIRGLGSIYYVAYAMGEAGFEHMDLVWSTLSLTILISIVLHGMTVTPTMRYLDRRSKRLAARHRRYPAAAAHGASSPADPSAGRTPGSDASAGPDPSAGRTTAAGTSAAPDR